MSSRILTKQDGTNLGPLTTTWSIPDDCTVNMRLCDRCQNCFQGQKCVTADDDESKSSLEDNMDCWPPHTGEIRSTYPFNGLGFYSPGLACPTGYTSACTAVYGERAGWQIQFNLVEGETAIGCCPE